MHSLRAIDSGVGWGIGGRLMSWETSRDAQERLPGVEVSPCGLALMHGLGLAAWLSDPLLVNTEQRSQHHTESMDAMSTGRLSGSEHLCAMAAIADR